MFPFLHGILGNANSTPLLSDGDSVWELEEASGNRIDSHGDNDLTAVNAPGNITGRVGDAVDLVPGSVQYLRIDSNVSLQNDGDGLTISAWVFPDATGAENQIVSKWLATGNMREYLLGVIGSDLVFRITTNGSTTISVSTPFSTTGEWVFVVAWMDATGLFLQVNNGTPVFTAHIGAVFTSITSAFNIGARSDGSGLWDGRIDQVVFSKRAWNEAAREYLWNGGNGRSYAEMAAAMGPFRDTPPMAVETFVIDDQYSDYDPSAIYDIDGDGLMDIVAAQATGVNRALFWYEQTDPQSWTRHTIDSGASFGTEVEGVAVIELDSVVYVFSLDQTEGKIRIYTPTTPGDPTGSWTKAELLTGRPFLQRGIPMDIDGDGEMELVYSWEGTNAGSGGIHWLDFDGADPMEPTDWTDYIMIQHPDAFWFAYERLDLAGNGRGDLVFSARNKTSRNPAADPGVYWIEEPADPTDSWTLHTIDSRDADWHKCDIGDFSGDGNGKDVIAVNVAGTLDIATYRFSDSYSRTDITPAGSEQWNVRALPPENGCNGGRSSFIVPHLNSFIYLYRWDGAAWESVALDYATQGHPLDNSIWWHDVDGDGVLEGFLADSSDANSKVVWIKVACG